MYTEPHHLKHRVPYERRHSSLFYGVSNVISHLWRRLAKRRNKHADRINETQPGDRDRLELGKSHGM